MFILSFWVYISNHTSFSVQNIFYFIQELKLCKNQQFIVKIGQPRSEMFFNWLQLQNI